MNKKVTSKEEIINNSIDLIFSDDFNIRTLSNNLNISIGAIYNYFPSKADLIIEATKQIFKNIFVYDEVCLNSVRDYIMWVFKCVENGNKQYKDFFNNHYLLFLKDSTYAKKEMFEFFNYFKNQLGIVMQNDPSLNKERFNDDFDQEQFIDFVFNNIYALILKKDYDCSFFLKVLERVIY